MGSRLRRFTARVPGDVPVDVYESQVDALHEDGNSLLVGTITVAIVALAIAGQAGSHFLLVFGLLLPVVAAARVALVAAYWDRRPRLQGVAAIRPWEMCYLAGATIYVALLGVWCMCVFWRVEDPASRFACTMTTIAYLVGVAGRNYSSRRVVQGQLLAIIITMPAAFALGGGMYVFMIPFGVLPMVASIYMISERLRQVLLGVVLAGREKSLLAERFDTALNNMPHGLWMFDHRARLIVSNQKGLDLLRLDAFPKSETADVILRRAASLDGLSHSSLPAFIAAFEWRLAVSDEAPIVCEGQAGSYLAFTFQKMNDGGSVVLIEDITDRRNAENAILNLARFDSLTQLPNRTFFRDTIGATLGKTGHNDRCALLFVDLDNFKQVNDTLGHSCGDALLCAVADRLRTIVREDDVIARLGGDEFVILQTSMRRLDQAERLATRIIQTLAEPIKVDGHMLLVGASIGIALAPRDGSDPDTLLKNADMALYSAKAKGRGSYCFFEPSMDLEVQARRALEIDLRRAVDNNDLKVYFQPLLNAATRKITGFEALVRWQHPVRGWISPAEFIPVAEEMGLIIDIGAYVLKLACAECATWPGDVRIAVNLSPLQFRKGDLIATVNRALAETGLDPRRLELEITETILLDNVKATLAVLADLRALGVRIALDDFGTGYSSLSYLHQFPLDKLKIDRSFLRHIETSDRSRTLLRTVTRLSRDLGLSVVVEGVETEDQMAFLVDEATVDEVQGFLFSPAIPSDKATELFKTLQNQQVAA